ncbi:hypothetical protein VQ056_14385 [Paenibacillus sp. JTLBN-2024]
MKRRHLQGHGKPKIKSVSPTVSKPAKRKTKAPIKRIDPHPSRHSGIPARYGRIRRTRCRPHWLQAIMRQITRPIRESPRLPQVMPGCTCSVFR